MASAQSPAINSPSVRSERMDRVASLMQQAQAKLETQIAGMVTAPQGHASHTLKDPNSAESIELDHRIRRCATRAEKLRRELSESTNKSTRAPRFLAPSTKSRETRNNARGKVARSIADAAQEKSEKLQSQVMRSLEIQVARRVPLPPSPLHSPVGTTDADHIDESSDPSNGNWAFDEVEKALQQAMGGSAETDGVTAHPKMNTTGRDAQ